MVIRRILYRSSIVQVFFLDAKVISVGNLVLGGTGKTPLCIAICRELMVKGFRPAILSRGYRSGLPKNGWAYFMSGEVVSGSQDCDRSGIHADEARMASYLLPGVPVIIGANRINAYQQFSKIWLQQKPTHWVLEDGFQHLAIHRDFDIVIQAQKRGESGSPVVPFGFQRDPDFCLHFADHVIYPDEMFHVLNTGTTLYRLERESPHLCPDTMWEELRSGRFPSFVLLTGIARPKRVVETLSAKNIALTATRFLRDHNLFSEDDEKWISSFPLSFIVFTTLKDYFREPAFFQKFGSRTIFLVDYQPSQIAVDSLLRSMKSHKIL